MLFCLLLAKVVEAVPEEEVTMASHNVSHLLCFNIHTEQK